MHRPPLIVVVVLASLLTAGCTTSPPPSDESLPDVGTAPDDAISMVAEDLDTVWSIAFAEDGRVFLTERPGRVRVLEASGALAEEPWATVEATEQGEAGLMGLALHPDFPNDPRVYLSYSYSAPGGVQNRIVSMVDDDGRGTDETILVDAIPGASIHDGSRLGFDGKGLLYATTGDAALAQHAQDPTSLAGKVLRMTADGEVPASNPDPDSYIYTSGHRNPQGLSFHPITGRAYISEHGPENHDEVNRLQAGANYGWPIVRGQDSTAGFTPSIWTSGPDGTIAPAGAAFIDAASSPLHGWFVFGTLKGTHLHVLELGTDGRTVESEHVLFDDRFGRIRAVTWGPDDALYLGTSNKDGRGSPGELDDRVLRVPLAVLEGELVS